MKRKLSGREIVGVIVCMTLFLCGLFNYLKTGNWLSWQNPLAKQHIGSISVPTPSSFIEKIISREESPSEEDKMVVEGLLREHQGERKSFFFCGECQEFLQRGSCPFCNAYGELTRLEDGTTTFLRTHYIFSGDHRIAFLVPRSLVADPKNISIRQYHEYSKSTIDSQKLVREGEPGYDEDNHSFMMDQEHSEEIRSRYAVVTATVGDTYYVVRPADFIFSGQPSLHFGLSIKKPDSSIEHGTLILWASPERQ